MVKKKAAKKGGKKKKDKAGAEDEQASLPSFEKIVLPPLAEAWVTLNMKVGERTASTHTFAITFLESFSLVQLLNWDYMNFQWRAKTTTCIFELKNIDKKLLSLI